jgi:hypothetical protein
MRFTVASITIENARKALALDPTKGAAEIRAIVQRRGMEAEAAIDAAMVRQDFNDDSVGASLAAVSLQNDPQIFDVVGLKYNGAVLAGGFDWEAN